MDPTRHQCRLCLETSDDLVNVFDDFQGSPIASVLSQHFWFQVHKNDGLSECLCRTCWSNTRTFHSFYTKIELVQKNYWNSAEKGSVDPDIANSIKEEQSGNLRETALQTDLTSVKYEEPPLEVIDLHASKEESSDYDYDDNSGGARRENVHSSDDDYEPPIKRRDKKTKENQSLLAPSKRSNGEPTTQFDKNEMIAQIREFFTMKCDICSDVFFETYREAKKHYRTVHKQCGYLTCCSKKFNRISLILEHIKHHLNPDAYRCGSCGKRFADKFALKYHVANHEPLTSRAFKCNLCSSSFTRASGLKGHMQNTHASENGGKFVCNKCSKIFRSKLSLACHVRFMHDLERTYICDTCARTFKTKTILLAHMRVHSATPPPKAQCNICDAWLKNEASLQNHLYQHKDYKAVDCPICKKVVKNKRALYKHVKQVHGERRHLCTFCDKSFKTLKILREHVAIHTGEYLYNCLYCDRKFESNANMFSHRKKAHFAEWTRDHAKKVALKET